jgi:hypothetical protein
VLKKLSESKQIVKIHSRQKGNEQATEYLLYGGGADFSQSAASSGVLEQVGL